MPRELRRILFLAPQPFYSLRGACLAHLQVLKALSAMGLSIDVITFPGGDDPRIPGVRIFRLPSFPGARWLPIGFSLRKVLFDAVLGAVLPIFLAAGRYGTVHASEESALLAACLKPFFGFRLVYDMDDILSQRLRLAGVLRSPWLLRLARALERWTLGSADLVVVNSPSTAEYAAAIAGPARVLSYDHVPFDEGWTGEAARAAATRDEPGLDGRKIILYAGNAEPYQGVELLLESLPFVFGRLPEALCVIVGGEADQIEGLRRRAESLGVAGQIRWLGKRPFPDAFRLMRRADVLISPMTQAKAVPMKLYAYAAAGRPIVATSLPNNTELLDDETALLVVPRPERLAEGILRVLEDAVLSKRLADNALGLARRCADRSALSCLREPYAQLGAR
jgi:glycosyltransferase involved in cell wall biosynthesis